MFFLFFFLLCFKVKHFTTRLLLVILILIAIIIIPAKQCYAITTLHHVNHDSFRHVNSSFIGTTNISNNQFDQYQFQIPSRKSYYFQSLITHSILASIAIPNCEKHIKTFSTLGKIQHENFAKSTVFYSLHHGYISIQPGFKPF